MNKLVTYILFVIVLLIVNARTAYAQDVAGASAALKYSPSEADNFDYRVENLRNFLSKFNSPLIPYASDFVAYADANGLDYRLVPSISGVESTFGKQIPFNSYNAYGWVNGNFSFKSWPDSIAVVSQTLKSNYVDRGLASVYQIAHVYAPPSTTWGGKVSYFMGKIDVLPLSFDI